jgi:hypothetical protein
MKKIVWVFMFGVLITACQKFKRQQSLTDQMKDHAGIWTMFDAVAMRSFLGLDMAPRGPYCMDFQPQQQRALIRFLDNPTLYKITVFPHGPKRYLFGCKKIVREFMVGSDCRPHEAMFSDNTSVGGKLIIASDGSQSAYHSLTQCVEAQKKGPWADEYWDKNFSEDGNTPWQRKAEAHKRMNQSGSKK